MSDNEWRRDMEQRSGEIGERLQQLERTAGYVSSSPLYVSPKLLLVWVTLLNIVLFIGGTVYTGLQVASIQQRYEEASIKIVEAKQKYDEAESKFVQTKAVLDDIQTQANQVSAQLRSTAKENADQVADVRARTEQELDLLKKSGASILGNIDTDFRRSATGLVARLEKSIDDNTKSIENRQKDIENLEPQIRDLSAKVSEKKLELSKIVKQAEDQITMAETSNMEFTKKMAELMKPGKITLNKALIVFESMDTLLKGILVGLVLMVLVSGVLWIVSGVLRIVSFWKGRKV